MKIVKLIIAIILIHLIVSISINFLYPDEHIDLITKNALKYDIEPALIAGVIKVESKFDSKVVSSAGARGLMQITPETGKWIAGQLNMQSFYAEDLFKPDLNIEMGTWYLSYLIGKYKSVDTALAAYNAGPGNVDKWLINEEYSDDGVNLKYIPFPETREYVKRVNENWRNYKKTYRLNRILY